MASSPTLISLPAELQSEIATHADRWSLLALRQVNAELDANTFQAFTKRFFTHHRHVATKHSLEVLRQITASQTSARHLGSVQIVAIGVDIEWNEYQTMPGAYPSKSGSLLPWCSKVDESWGWQYTSVLDDVFRNLANSQVCQSLSMDYFNPPHHPSELSQLDLDPNDPTTTDLELRDINTYGLATFERNIQPWASPALMGMMFPLVFDETVLRALFRSNYRPTALVAPLKHAASFDPPQHGVDHWVCRLPSRDLAGMVQVYANLKQFTVDFEYGLDLFALLQGS